MPSSPLPPPRFALGDRVLATFEATVTAVILAPAGPVPGPRYLVEVQGRAGSVELPVHLEAQLAPLPAPGSAP